MAPILPIILSGGAGTRLWPLSTERSPKQFLRIWDGGRSLFQETVLRLVGEGFEPAAVICNIAQEDLVRRDAADAGAGLTTILLEPARRDSAAAIAAAAAWAEEAYGPDVVLAVFPSDHRIADAAAFRDLVVRSAAVAAQGHVVTFGIAPTRPATEFGYIERGAALAGFEDAYAVAQFREKPELATARAYVESGRFDWNSGMFVFTARTFRDEAVRHMPDIWETARSAIARGRARSGALEIDPDTFSGARQTSIDYALMEKAERVAVLPARFAWSDVGNWGAVHEALASGPGGTVTQGDVIAKDTAGALVITDGLPVRVLGLEGVAVVVAEGGVLVTRLDQAARVKEVLG
ncbi:MAG: Mannose-1-phosphate guanylyltransferase (GDP) [uncultured Microvirga sp.]|uniref:Mannose-1-phosphate guanylyltransferase (GDP) n=1 Tax=uncultured Microvirga sp. TaxID=412392 RepID=A0A6J4L283_9HYPH|nr:MAG: Mannose-1-phosphate guanylyltransferase (GDP) [uncultured Microvirga sp.]